MQLDSRQLASAVATRDSIQRLLQDWCELLSGILLVVVMEKGGSLFVAQLRSQHLLKRQSTEGKPGSCHQFTSTRVIYEQAGINPPAFIDDCSKLAVV